MTKKPANSVSNEDIMFLMEKLYGKVENVETDVSTLKKDVSVLKDDVSTLKTVTSNMVGDIQKIEENTSVLGYHNSEHFDKDEQQDKRLDRIEHHIQLPAFA